MQGRIHKGEGAGSGYKNQLPLTSATSPAELGFASQIQQEQLHFCQPHSPQLWDLHCVFEVTQGSCCLRGQNDHRVKVVCSGTGLAVLKTSLAQCVWRRQFHKRRVQSQAQNCSENILIQSLTSSQRDHEKFSAVNVQMSRHGS